MTLDIGLHEVCVRVGVRYVITKFSRMDSLPNFLTHGAPLARFARESSANKLLSNNVIKYISFHRPLVFRIFWAILTELHSQRKFLSTPATQGKKIKKSKIKWAIKQFIKKEGKGKIHRARLRLRASSPIWARKASLARTREPGPEKRRACNDLSGAKVM